MVKPTVVKADAKASVVKDAVVAVEAAEVEALEAVALVVEALEVEGSEDQCNRFFADLSLICVVEHHLDAGDTVAIDTNNLKLKALEINPFVQTREVFLQF